jgi:hypothetical protein
MTATAVPGPLTARHASLDDLAAMLVEQQARKIDVVAPPAALRARDGMLVVAGTEPVLTADGVDLADGCYRPTAVFDEGIGDKLGIHLGYLRKLRAQAIGLYDVNVNGWLDRSDPSRKFLVRCYRGHDGSAGVARALLSDGYKRIDHLDVLTAIMDGVRQAGIEVQVQGCDLTERRMYVRLYSEQVAAMAPALLAGYRSPFSGAEGAANPVVWGGLVITNSETGDGAAAITPRLVVQVCRNGMTITEDSHRAVHTGGRLAEGVIDWSADTHRKNLELITAKARDAVTRFLDPRYVRTVVARMERDAATPVERPQEAIELVSAQLRFTDEQRNAVLGHFIKGGSLTAGGVMHAVTSVAQTLPDADAAHGLESQAMRVLALAAGGR